MRLDKALSNSGYGSRKEIKELIKAGKISVNGTVARDPGAHVDPEKDVICINGIEIKFRRYIYLMLNKPQGVITARWDKRHKTVLDIIPDKYKKFELSPAGRLDIDTEGLLILTNDGPLIHELISPSKNVDKTYFAILDKEAGQEDREAFAQGVVLDDGYKTLPALLEYDEADKRKIFLTIREGKYHQVKRMFEAVGKRVLYLKRVSMAGIVLDEKLATGEVRELTDEELQIMLKNIKKC